MIFYIVTRLINRREGERAGFKVGKERAPRIAALIEQGRARHNDCSVGFVFRTDHDFPSKSVKECPRIVGARQPGVLTQSSCCEVDGLPTTKRLTENVAKNRSREICGVVWLGNRSETTKSIEIEQCRVLIKISGRAHNAQAEIVISLSDQGRMEIGRASGR